MARYVAFLRAINVGGRYLTMADLRRHFAPLPLTNVETFIASGNVVFESSSRSAARLEQAIEVQLQKALKFPVPTFLRSIPELATLLEHPVLSAHNGKDPAVHVMFLRDVPPRDMAKKLAALNNDVDQFHVAGREVLWVLHGGFSDSKVGGMLDKALNMPTTVRNSTTVRRLVKKYSS
jgi:uncharacterized protein (DUF1697 family)